MNLTFHTVLRELREGLNGQPTKNIMPLRYLSDCYVHNAYVMGNGLHRHAPSLPMHPQQSWRLDEIQFHTQSALLLSSFQLPKKALVVRMVFAHGSECQR